MKTLCFISIYLLMASQAFGEEKSSLPARERKAICENLRKMDQDNKVSHQWEHFRCKEFFPMPGAK